MSANSCALNVAGPPAVSSSKGYFSLPHFTVTFTCTHIAVSCCTVVQTRMLTIFVEFPGTPSYSNGLAYLCRLITVACIRHALRAHRRKEPRLVVGYPILPSAAKRSGPVHQPSDLGRGSESKPAPRTRCVSAEGSPKPPPQPTSFGRNHCFRLMR